MAQLSGRSYIRRSVGILLALAVALIVLVIASPKIGYDRMDANEMAVVRELQFINTLQIQYKSRFQRFAATLAELGPQAANLIPATLSSGDKDGYLFTIRATPSGYTVNANPKIFNRSGYRTFYTDQNGIIRQNWSAKPANASSPELK
jgi:hypothetical protein